MIDKRIFYVWFGKRPIPDKDKRCMDTWKRLCPEYEIIRIDESSYDFSNNPIGRMFYDKKIWAFAADAARFDILSRESGFYLDTDVELLKSLDVLRDMPSFVIKKDERYTPAEMVNNGRFLLNNAFLGSNDDKTIFNRCVQSLEIAYEKSIPPAQAMNVLLLSDNPSMKGDDELEIFDKRRAYLPQSTLILEDMNTTEWTIGIHHANLSWKAGWVKWNEEKKCTM